MTPDPKQRDAALRMANDRRVALKRLKEEIRQGKVSLKQIMLEQPPELGLFPIIDILRLNGKYGISRHRSTGHFQRLGRRAVKDGINLLMPLGTASLRTRQWVADNAEWRKKKRSNLHVIGETEEEREEKLARSFEQAERRTLRAVETGTGQAHVQRDASLASRWDGSWTPPGAA